VKVSPLLLPVIEVRVEMDSHLYSSLLAIELAAHHKGSAIEDQREAVTTLASAAS
jgi:hypothetical protein